MAIKTIPLREVEEKVENMRNTMLIPGNIKLSVSTTVQMLNIGHLQPIDEFCKSVLKIAPNFASHMKAIKQCGTLNKN